MPGGSAVRLPIVAVPVSISPRERTVSEGQVPGKRVTIADIARRAGVSKGAVSFALNNRPGLSEVTRRRILSVAGELDWYPNSAARSLSAARADVWGLVIARPARTLAAEHYYMELVTGIESVLFPRAIFLHLQVAAGIEEEIGIYQRWRAEGRVDGVLVADLRVDDPRISALRRMRLPAVIIGGPDPSGQLPAAWVDESSSMAEVVRYLATLGHRQIARVAGMPELLHIRDRTGAFSRACQEAGARPVTVSTDFTPAGGAGATRQLLSLPDPPTAVVYDSDVLAIAGLAVTREMGISVPADLSIVAWDGSALSEAMYPALTALDRDIPAFGAAAANKVLELLEHGTVSDVELPRGKLTPRGTTRSSRAAG